MIIVTLLLVYLECDDSDIFMAIFGRMTCFLEVVTSTEVVALSAVMCLRPPQAEVWEVEPTKPQGGQNRPGR